MSSDFYSDPMNMFQAIGAGSGPGSLQMPKMVSTATVRREARANSSSILEDWNSA
jgi:hypothetical protein